MITTTIDKRKEIRLELFPSIESTGKLLNLRVFLEKQLYNGPVYIPKWTKYVTMEKEGRFIWSHPKKIEKKEVYYNVILYPNKNGDFTNESWLNYGCFLTKELEEINIGNTTHAVRLSGKKLDLGFEEPAELLVRVPEIRLIFENDPNNCWYYYFKENIEVLKFVEKLKKLGHIKDEENIFFTEEQESMYANIIDDVESYLKTKIEEYKDD